MACISCRQLRLVLHCGELDAATKSLWPGATVCSVRSSQRRLARVVGGQSNPLVERRIRAELTKLSDSVCWRGWRVAIDLKLRTRDYTP